MKYVMDRHVNHSGTDMKKGQLCPDALTAEMVKKGYAHPVQEHAEPAPAPKVVEKESKAK